MPAASARSTRVADFKTHITTSTALGLGYAVVANRHFNVPLPACALAGALCSVSGMLPDLDSDSGVPLRESLAFSAACIPAMMLPRFESFGWPNEGVILACAIVYVVVRFGLGTALKKYTVHRGMFHSIPAALIAGEVAFLVCASGDIYLRAYKACAVLVGFFSHLILDEIWSVRVQGGRIGLKSSSGTAMKLWGDSMWANISCYGKLVLLGVLVFNDPIWATVSPEASRFHEVASGVVQTIESRANLQLPQGLIPRAGAIGSAPSNNAAPSNYGGQQNVAGTNYNQQYYQQSQQYATQRGYPQSQGYAQQQPQQPVYQYQQPWQSQTPAYSQTAPQQPYYPPQSYAPQNTPAQNYAPQGYPQQPYATPQTNGWQQTPAAGAPYDPRVQYGPMTRRY
ncbi:MAG: hypothetical protein C0483_03335 [Pirellula sp.]|nr:hypothetical protein [Pirellula sp.]